MITYYTLTIHLAGSTLNFSKITLEGAIANLKDLNEDTLEIFIYPDCKWRHVPREDVTRVDLVRHSNDTP